MSPDTISPIEVICEDACSKVLDLVGKIDEEARALMAREALIAWTAALKYMMDSFVIDEEERARLENGISKMLKAKDDKIN